MSTIRATVTDQKLVITDAPELASGGKGTNYVAFEFCELWDGFTKTAVFYNRIDYKKNMAVGTNGICRIPSEIIAKKGRFFFGVFGIDEERNIKTSEVVPYGIKEGGYNEPSEPTDDFWMQVLAEIAKNETDIKEAVEEVKQVKGFAEEAMSLAESHALRHSVNGEDPLYPGDIGAAKQEHTHDAYDIEGMMESYFNEAEETLELGDLFEYEDEKYYVPSVDNNGILSWTASVEGMPDVPRTNVKGDPGITPDIQIGNVETLEPDEDATVTKSGTTEKPVFNFAIPRGEEGVGITDIEFDQNLEDGGFNTVKIILTNDEFRTFEIMNGNKGTGIRNVNVEQSNEEGGTSFVTIELTDDTAYGYTVKNGSKGETGSTGLPGLVWKGEWNTETDYRAIRNGQISRDVVFYNGSAYVVAANSPAPVIGIIPEGDETGSWALLAKRGDMGSAEDVDARFDAIEEELAVLNPFEVTSLTVSPSVVEIGNSVSSAVISWVLSKEPVSLTVAGQAVAPAKSGSLTVNEEISGTKTFSLSARDAKGTTVTEDATVNFYSAVHYGTNTSNLTKVLTGTRKRTFTVNAAEGEYIIYVCPVDLGNCTFKVGGFEGGFNLMATNDLTNDFGYTESFNIYQSAQAGLGETTVEVS